MANGLIAPGPISGMAMPTAELAHQPRIEKMNAMPGDKEAGEVKLR